MYVVRLTDIRRSVRMYGWKTDETTAEGFQIPRYTRTHSTKASPVLNGISFLEIKNVSHWVRSYSNFRRSCF
jgi:hypothetical protein